MSASPASICRRDIREQDQVPSAKVLRPVVCEVRMVPGLGVGVGSGLAVGLHEDNARFPGD